jgi:serine protease AprX
MAKKKIIAHFMHESEEAEARQRMTDVETTDSYLVGEINEDEIPALREKGLIVQSIEEQPQIETPARDVEPFLGVRISRPGGRLMRATEPAIGRVGANTYIIQLKGPMLEKWRQGFKELGIRLLEYLPKNSYTVKLTPEQINAVNALTYVSRVRLYGPEDTGPVNKTAISDAPPLETGVSMLTYDVRLHQEEDQPQVLDWLRGQNVSIAGASGKKIRLYLMADSPLANNIAALPEVASIEEYVPPKLHNDFARRILCIDRAPGPNPAANIPQTGDGQVVGVADTGLDVNHPEFQGRILGIVALGRRNDYSDPHGHGTHVAGSVLGDGTASGGAIRGTAPGAKLFFQSLLDADGGLGGLPLSLGDLFEEAYQAGARIHNNSWGAATPSTYTFNSIEVDEFVDKRRDMLIVISAGNEGDAACPVHSQPGYVDWLSIGSPASAKNALTVGASRSARTSGGLSQLTYGNAWPANFPAPPIADQNVSGDTEQIAAFSSRGPCDDRRIKPDVVGPGTDIASAKSSRAPLRNFWGPYPGNNQYAFMGGTSMAAPLIAGCAALVREYYVKTRNHEPSAALLKATLINSTRMLTGQDASADHPHIPNFHQGFGCINMLWAIPNPSQPNLKLEFLDTWKTPANQFTTTGQRQRLKFSISGGERLRICLAWTDPPARALQNNLNLFVQHIPSGQKWIGNTDLPMGLKIPDPDNNVELVQLENPQAGEYLIQISATNLLRVPQDLALVVTGELTTPLSNY